MNSNDVKSSSQKVSYESSRPKLISFFRSTTVDWIWITLYFVGNSLESGGQTVVAKNSPQAQKYKAQVPFNFGPVWSSPNDSQQHDLVVWRPSQPAVKTRSINEILGEKIPPKISFAIVSWFGKNGHLKLLYKELHLTLMGRSKTKLTKAYQNSACENRDHRNLPTTVTGVQHPQSLQPLLSPSIPKANDLNHLFNLFLLLILFLTYFQVIRSVDQIHL